MKQVETEGETLDEAIANALDLLGVERDNVSLDVLVEEKTGLLGFGRQNARVRATIREAVSPIPVLDLAAVFRREQRQGDTPGVLLDREEVDGGTIQRLIRVPGEEVIFEVTHSDQGLAPEVLAWFEDRPDAREPLFLDGSHLAGHLFNFGLLSIQT